MSGPDAALDGLRELLGTEAEVVPFAGPVHAAVEAALASCMGPDDLLLVPVNGPDGRRLVQLASAHGIDVRTVTAPETRPWEVTDVAAALARHPGVTAIAAVHHEAAVGLVNPLAELGALARERGLLLLVDAASSIGGIELALDAQGVDVCIGAAHACLDGPAGLAPMTIGARAWERILGRRGRRPGWHLDLANWRWARVQWGAWTPDPEATTPPAELVAFGAALERVRVDGLDARLACYVGAAAALRRGMRALGLEPLVADDAASPVVTALAAPDDVDVAALRAWMAREHGITVAPARENFVTRAFRVRHWGAAAEPAAIDRVVGATRESLARLRRADVD